MRTAGQSFFRFSFVAVALAAAALLTAVTLAHAVETPIAGDRINANDTTHGRRMLFISTDVAINVSAEGGAGDPTINGGSLEILNTAGTGESTVIALPARNWHRIPARGWRYKELVKNPPLQNYRISAVMSEDPTGTRKRLKVRIRDKVGTVLTYTLDETAQGSVGLRFVTAADQHCARFGGDIRKDQGLGVFVRGIFSAREAPAPPACNLRSPGPQPNIIVIMTDDQRADTIQYMPHLEALANEGVRFDRAYANSPVCGPSRASFFSGRRASTLGLEDENEGAYEAFDDSETIAVALQANGYVTGHVGEYINGYRNGFPAVPPGWDHWLAFSDSLGQLFGPGSVYVDPLVSRNGVAEQLQGHSIDLFTDAAIEFIEEHARKRPFFLSIAYWAPHIPLSPHPDYSGIYDGFAPPMPPSFDEGDLSDKPLLLQQNQWPDELWQLWAPYLEILTHVDDSLGLILQAIEDAGIGNDTLIVFTSDNGFMFGEHGHVGKGLAYEESARIPMVIRYPLRDAPGVILDPVAIHDLAPTIADYARISFPADGISLRDTIEGWPLQRTSIFVELSARETIDYVAEVWNDFKRIIWAGENSGLIEEYDLENDPFELEGAVE